MHEIMISWNYLQHVYYMVNDRDFIYGSRNDLNMSITYENTRDIYVV